VAHRLSVLLLFVAASAQAETRPPYGGRITGSLLGAPSATLDPAAAMSHADVSLAGLVFDTLYRLDGNGTPVAHLAADLPSLSADGLVARITLRDGIVCHDKRKLTITDVAASLRRATTVPTAAWALGAVKTIAVDKDTLVLTLHRASPELPALLAAPQLGILPGGKPGRGLPVGTGPYLVKRVDAGRVELDAWASHFAGRPYTDGITLRWFDDSLEEARIYESGGADVSLRGDVAFPGHQPKFPTSNVDGPATVLVFLGFGRAHENILKDVGFRRGVSLAIGRASLKNMGTGERVVAAVLPESPDLGGAPATAAELSDRLAEAKTLLARVPNLAGQSLEILVDRSRPDDATVANKVIGALDRAGVVVRVSRVEAGELQRRVDLGLCDLYIGQLVAPTTDVRTEYALAFAAGGDGWPSSRLQTAPLVRDAAAKAFGERLPVVPLFHRAVRAHHQKVLQGLAFDALGRLALPDSFFFPRR
jgi:peptide/nickel transport system substrate-binding protein